jgi:hypothetical protein
VSFWEPGPLRSSATGPEMIAGETIHLEADDDLGCSLSCEFVTGRTCLQRSENPVQSPPID